jgi:polysaccharide biosynthesis/export protein
MKRFKKFMRKSWGITILILLPFFFTSCLSNRKFIYLQSKSELKKDSNDVILVKKNTYKLQNGDILYIKLTTEDHKMNEIFVPQVQAQGIAQGVGTVGTALYYVGFTINSKGNIDFPYLGDIHLEGLTVESAKEEISNYLKKYFKTFHLNVKLADFKFSIIGYVNHPGQYFFNTNSVNLVEAIAQAGDLKNLASRFSLQLYRQYPDGIRMHEIDLTDRSIINSPYWYVQPNDVLYVIPLKTRTFGDFTNLQSSIGSLTPLISTFILVLNTYLLLQRL